MSRLGRYLVFTWLLLAAMNIRSEEPAHFTFQNNSLHLAFVSQSESGNPQWVTKPGEFNRTIAYSEKEALTEAQSLAPVAIDNQGKIVTRLQKESGIFVPSGECPTTGTYTNRWTAEDTQGNKSVPFIQVITIVDNSAPAFMEVPPVIKVVDAGICESMVNYPDIRIADACPDKLTLISGRGRNGIFSLGTSWETWQAIDRSGNSSILKFPVTVVEKNESPVLHQVKDIKVFQDCKEIEILLTGIDPVSGCGPQQKVDIQISADNKSLIPHAEVFYAGETTARVVMTLSGEATGSSSVIIILKDDGGIENGGNDTGKMKFSVTIVPNEEGPILVKPVPHLLLKPKMPVTIRLDDYFKPQIPGDKLTYGITLADGSPVPGWLTTDNFNGEISGIMPNIVFGPLEVIIRATDSFGLTTHTKTWIGTVIPGKFALSCYISSPEKYLQNGISIMLYKRAADNSIALKATRELGETSAILFYGLEPGNYAVKAMITDSLEHPGLIHTWYDKSTTPLKAKTIEIKREPHVSIDMEILENIEIPVMYVNNSLVAYPNPTGGEFVINLPAESGSEVEILNGSGIPVFKNGYAAGVPVLIDIRGQQAGIYFVRVLTKTDRITGKIIKQ